MFPFSDFRVADTNIYNLDYFLETDQSAHRTIKMKIKSIL